ncbi:hypothetical protein CL659_05265, partial [bacterium]|nr:hypothetical protein [bacterium]
MNTKYLWLIAGLIILVLSTSEPEEGNRMQMIQMTKQEGNDWSQERMEDWREVEMKRREMMERGNWDRDEMGDRREMERGNWDRDEMEKDIRVFHFETSNPDEARKKMAEMMESIVKGMGNMHMEKGWDMKGKGMEKGWDMKGK